MSITRETMDRYRRMGEEDTLEQLRKQFDTNVSGPSALDEYRMALSTPSELGGEPIPNTDPDWLLRLKMMGSQAESGIHDFKQGLSAIASKLTGLFSGGA